MSGHKEEIDNITNNNEMPLKGECISREKELDYSKVQLNDNNQGDSDSYITTRGQQPSDGFCIHSKPYVMNSKIGETIAGVLGNTLEWYDFAVFGFLSDILGEVFFPPTQEGNTATMKSFMVFGGAFVMRPIGGVVMGYIGDKFGAKKALIISIFLMAFPTFIMGCLPSYQQAGNVALILLIVIRLVQGLSVGGQLMSSLVFTLENHPRSQWGFYGSFVMAAANCGTLLGGLIAFILRQNLTHEELVTWGWRIPFLSGIVVSFAGFYLHCNSVDDYYHVNRHNAPACDSESSTKIDASEGLDNTAVQRVNCHTRIQLPEKLNPFLHAIERKNLRSLLAASMVPMLWASGFYLSFVWMAIYMSNFIEKPVPLAFGVNFASQLCSVTLFFPVAGMLSDKYRRSTVMTCGGLILGILGPVMVIIIGKGHALTAFLAQCLIGVSLSCWGAPMCAWLVESFEPESRLTSVAIGYNVAHAIAGGSTPAIATWIVDNINSRSPGIIYTIVSVVSIIGLHFVAPNVAQIPKSLPDVKHNIDDCSLSLQTIENEENMLI